MKKKNKKFLKIIIIAFFGYLLIGGLSFWYLNKINYYTTQLNVPKERFVKATTLVHLEDVEKTLGFAADHEFTFSDNNHEYVLLSCYLKKEDYWSYWFLFEDKLLKTIISPVYYKERPKSWDIEEDSRIQKVLNASGFSRGEIIEDINRPEENFDEFMDPLPVFIFWWAFLPTNMRKFANDYEKNNELKQRYNGLLAHLGMSPEQADKLFGCPIRSYYTPNGDLVRIYGEEISLDINPFFEFSWVATVFRDKKLIKVLSNSFFNPDWKKTFFDGAAKTIIRVRHQ